MAARYILCTCFNHCGGNFRCLCVSWRFAAQGQLLQRHRAVLGTCCHRQVAVSGGRCYSLWGQELCTNVLSLAWSYHADRKRMLRLNDLV
jgi:hypothetical protein